VNKVLLVSDQQNRLRCEDDCCDQSEKDDFKSHILLMISKNEKSCPKRVSIAIIF